MNTEGVNFHPTKRGQFSAAVDRPPRDEMIAFIDSHGGHFGVELICRALRAAIPVS